MRGAYGAILVFGLGVCAPNASFAQALETRSSVTSGFDYTVGNYGQSSDTTITYVPFTYKHETGRWIYAVTVPYIEVEGPGNVTREVGRFRGPPRARSQAHAGLGDIVLAATYNLFFSPAGQVLDLSGKLKLGTADRAKGLGTGEEDVYVQIDAYGNADGVTPFATVGYKWLGNPPGVELRDVYYLAFGASRALHSGREVGAMWFGQQKAAPAGAAQSEITVFLSQALGRAWRARLYGVLGLADGSPDYGVGAMVTVLY